MVKLFLAQVIYKRAKCGKIYDYPINIGEKLSRKSYQKLDRQTCSIENLRAQKKT